MKMRCVLIGILPLVLLFSGCGPRLDPGLPGFSEDMSDEEKIARVLADVHEGLEKRKIYRVLAHVSRDYRDKDGREIDLLIAHDGLLYPIEVKKAATVRADDVAAFRLLEQRGAKAGPGAVLSLSAESIPLDRKAENLPIGWL